MSRYKINNNFRHWKKGDILEKYEYNRLPIEVKERCTEVVPEVVEVKPDQTRFDEPVAQFNTVTSEPEVRSSKFQKKVSE